MRCHFYKHRNTSSDLAMIPTKPSHPSPPPPRETTCTQHTHTFTFTLSLAGSSNDNYAYKHTCKYIYLHKYIYTHIYTHISTQMHYRLSWFNIDRFIYFLSPISDSSSILLKTGFQIFKNWSNLFFVFQAGLDSEIFHSKGKHQEVCHQSTFEEHIIQQHTNKFSKYIYYSVSCTTAQRQCSVLLINSEKCHWFSEKTSLCWIA